jgi:hypothetical protein
MLPPARQPAGPSLGDGTGPSNDVRRQPERLFHAQPSLNFHGRCDETLEFYERAIGGKIGNLGLATDKFGVGRMVLVAD